MANDQDMLSFIRDDIQEIKRDVSEIRKDNKGYMLKMDCNALGGKCDVRLAGYATKTEVNPIREAQKSLVTKAEFNPVKYVVFSLVMVILAQVARMIVTGGIE